MASIIVYIWPPHDTFVGHSSMQLSDDTYISFWPRDQVNVMNPQSPPMLGQDIAEDISNEGGVGPKSFVIIVNNEGLRNIRDWWDTFKSTYYHFKSNNCSTAIFLGLRAAFPFLRCLDGEVPVWVPKAIGFLAKELSGGNRCFDQQTVRTTVETAQSGVAEIVSNYKGGGKKGYKKGQMAAKKSGKK